jgi:Ca-activated chloride channel family protein
MEQLADAGDGQYTYVDKLSEALRVFRENISGTLLIISRNTKAQIEFDPERVAKYRLLGYENRDIRDEDFRNNKIDAGEIGAGHEVTALYEVKLRDGLTEGPLATVRIRYEKPEGGEFVELEETIGSGDLYRSVDKAPGDLILDAAVTEFAEILRKSYWAKESSPAAVLDLLQKLPESLAGSADVIELRELVERASALGE